jgi:hypothetical protein
MGKSNVFLHDTSILQHMRHLGMCDVIQCHIVNVLEQKSFLIDVDDGQEEDHSSDPDCLSMLRLDIFF